MEKLLERERVQERGRCEMERGSSRRNERWVRDGTLANHPLFISLFFSSPYFLEYYILPSFKKFVPEFNHPMTTM